jgi:hypothetical protein
MTSSGLSPSLGLVHLGASQDGCSRCEGLDVQVAQTARKSFGEAVGSDGPRAEPPALAEERRGPTGRETPHRSVPASKPSVALSGVE